MDINFMRKVMRLSRIGIILYWLLLGSPVPGHAQSTGDASLTDLQDQVGIYQSNYDNWHAKWDSIFSVSVKMTSDCPKCLADASWQNFVDWNLKFSSYLGQMSGQLDTCRSNYNNPSTLVEHLLKLRALDGNAAGAYAATLSILNAIHMNDERGAYYSEIVFKDRGSSKITDPSGLVATISLPFTGVPMYEDFNYNNTQSTNGTTNASTSTANTVLSCVGLHGDLAFHALKTDHFDFAILAGGTYCNLELANSLLQGSSGGTIYYDYNVGGELQLGGEKFKWFGQYMYGSRHMEDNSTTDLSDYGGGMTTTTGSVTYSYQRLSTGFQINFDDYGDDDEKYLKIFASVESPDYAKGARYFGFGLNLRVWLDVSFSVIPGYPLAGQPDYTLTSSSTSGTLWYASIGKAFKIF